MSEDNIAFRLKLLLKKLEMNSSTFADQCGIARATFSQLLTGRNKKISDVLIGQIHAAFPSVSILWLLFNEGPMFTGQPENFDQNPTVIDNKEGNTGTNGESQTVKNSWGPDQVNGTDESHNPGRVNSEDPMEYGSPMISNGTQPGGVASPQRGQNVAKFPSENPEIPSSGKTTMNYGKENGLKSGNYTTENNERKIINNSENTPEIINEIEFFRQKTRKVVQVTIYYDDSTFETLFPR